MRIRRDLTERMKFVHAARSAGLVWPQIEAARALWDGGVQLSRAIEMAKDVDAGTPLDSWIPRSIRTWYLPRGHQEGHGVDKVIGRGLRRLARFGD